MKFLPSVLWVLALASTLVSADAPASRIRQALQPQVIIQSAAASADKTAARPALPPVRTVNPTWTGGGKPVQSALPTPAAKAK